MNYETFREKMLKEARSKATESEKHFIMAVYCLMHSIGKHKMFGKMEDDVTEADNMFEHGLEMIVNRPSKNKKQRRKKK